MMRQPGNLKFLVIISILFLIENTSGLKCWRCSSDSTNSKFCGDTIDISQTTEQQKKWSYVDCEAQPKPAGIPANHISKCLIRLQHVHDVPSYRRECYWEAENVPSNSCTVQNFNPSFVKSIACRTCTLDGCNDQLATPIPIVIPVEKDNLVVSSTEKPNNSAPTVMLSHTIIAMLIMLSVVIGY